MKVELLHNPYQGNLQILVNGQSRPRLEKYANKPFSVWYRDILTLLDGEINEPYTLNMIANASEAEIISGLSSYTKYCQRVSVSPFLVNMTTENRIRGISSIFSNHYNVAVRFCILPSLSRKINRSDIQSLLKNNIFNNQIWTLQDEYCETDRLSNNPSSCEYLFLLASDDNEITAQVQSNARKGYYSEVCRIILDGKENISWSGNNLTVHCQSPNWGKALQQLMESLILGDYYHKICCQIPEQYKTQDFLQIKQRAKVKIPDSVEQGEKVEIIVTSGNGTVPPVEVIIRNTSVLKAEGNVLIGLAEGSSNVQVFEKGTSQLLASGMVNVLFVPKIRELFAEDVTLRHGESLKLDAGDSAVVKYKYAPDNAENASDIRWSSDDTSIAEVNAFNGKITAVNAGKCNVRCEIGNIGFSVSVEVIPIPEKILFPDIYGEDITLIKGESCVLNTEVVPSNANHGDIFLRSDDTSIVRVDDKIRLFAESEGITRIIAEENLHNVKTAINVRVIATKKKGFFSKIFNK